MGTYRRRLQIIADILAIVNGKAKKTRIMYQGNLSYRLLCRYLDEVMGAGLVKPEDDDRYVLTAKGKEFLSRHEKYAKRCKSLKEYLNLINGEKVALEKMCLSAGKVSNSLNRLDKNRILIK